jgi:HPt (histidine-containing phosphotransfer) domain-containing protein
MKGNPMDNPQTPDDQSVIDVDLSGFNEVAGGDEHEERELLSLYASQLDQKVPTLKAAVDSGDCVQIKLIAHSLAGSSSTCGLLKFAETLRELEQRGAKKDLDSAKKLFAEADTQAAQTKAAILRKLGK